MKTAVTGAAGNLGTRIVKQLASRIGGENVVAVVRDAAKARDRLGEAITIAEADYGDQGRLRNALDGAERLVLVPSAAPPAERRLQHDNLVDAAEALGVEHVIYAGLIDNDAASPFWPASTIAYTEGRLAASSLGWTFLRNGIYAQLLAPALAVARDTASYTTTAAEGATCYASWDDLAEATAVVATGTDHAGKSYRLCGERATEAEVASILSEILGRPVSLNVVDEETLRRHMGDAADFVLGIHRAVSGGYFDRWSNDMEALLGRPPQSIRAALGGGTR